MSADIESAVTVGRAWWGFDQLAEDVMTTQEAFGRSGLDWLVEKRPLFTTPILMPDNVLGDLKAGLLGVDAPRMIHVPDKFAVMRTKDNVPLGIVGTEYQVVQNVQMFDFLDALTAGEDKVAKWDSAGSLRGGRHVWALLNLPGSDIMIGKGDRVLKYLLITNAHDGSAACRVIPTTVRVECWNTLQAAVMGEFRDLAVTIRHSGDIENKIAQAKLALAKAGEMFGAFEKVANALAETVVTRAGYEELLEALFPTPEDDATDVTKRHREEAVTLLTAAVQEERLLLAAPDMTYWTVLNGVTRFVDHKQAVQNRKRENREARFEHAMVGRGADFKARATKEIIDRVGLEGFAA